MSKKKEYISEAKTHWEAPAENDARILGMPNIPKPLFFQNPRSFMGPAAWAKVRKACYADADYTCEACGYKGEPGKMHAHEVYTIDYAKGTSTFIRPVCLCPRCHLYVIHTGRALTMYKHGDPFYNAEHLLEGAEHGFKVVSEWNKSHSEKIRLFSAMLDYLKQEELCGPMEELIKKYGIEFYSPVAGKKQAAWGDWRLIYNGKEYKTPYKDQEDLDKHLEKANKRDHRLEMTNRMQGGVFDEIDNIIKEGEK